MLSNWEKALEKFLEPWEKMDEVEAAMLTGSYATGNQSRYSDIDVHIILADNVTWRERGNKIIDGFLIEYFANPPGQLKKYLKEDWSGYSRNDSNMYVNGKILFDKTGIMGKLKENAKNELARPFPEMNKINLELGRYFIWDELQNLFDLYYNNDPGFNYSYHLLLDLIINKYSQYKKSPLLPKSKLWKCLFDEEFRSKYNMKINLEKDFIALIHKCLTAPNIEAIKELSEYTLENMGRFNIDGWKLRSPVEL